MKNWKNFAAQQLSKSEMNKVRGGWNCFVITGYDENGNNIGYWASVPGKTQFEAADYVALHRPAGAIGVNC